jgi:hypothetical protein
VKVDEYVVQLMKVAATALFVVVAALVVASFESVESLLLAETLDFVWLWSDVE